MSLPDPVPPVLRAALASLDKGRRAKATARLIDRQRTAEDLSYYFQQVGSPVSASTIRTYRRHLDRLKVQGGT